MYNILICLSLLWLCSCGSDVARDTVREDEANQGSQVDKNQDLTSPPLPSSHKTTLIDNEANEDIKDDISLPISLPNGLASGSSSRHNDVSDASSVFYYGGGSRAHHQCGNGIKEGQEACDDGNISDGDGCNAYCELECVVPADRSCTTALRSPCDAGHYVCQDNELICKPNLAPCGQEIFLSAVGYDIGENANFLDIGDINGDGYLDVVNTNTADNTMSVLLNNKDGTFNTQNIYAQAIYPVGQAPLGIALGDIDNDGDLDIVEANNDDNNFWLFLNDGNGNFSVSPNSPYYVGDAPRDLALGDFNQDGYLDVVVSNSADDNVSVFFNDGNGSFQYQTTYDVGDFPDGLALGDVNDDGYLDIAIANVFSNNASVLINNDDGSFAMQVIYAAVEAPYSIALGDLDNDGDLDMAINNSAENTENEYNSVSILLNNGQGIFGGLITYGIGKYSYSLALGDIDNDGDLDITRSNCRFNSCNPYVSVILNNGDATFTNQIDYVPGNFPDYIVLGDVNNDGYLDIAGVNDNLFILLNNNGSFINPLSYEVSDPDSIAMGDIDNDGDIDIATCGLAGNVSIIFNNNAMFTLPSIYSVDSGCINLAMGDVDGNGFIDIVTANSFANTISILLNNYGVFAINYSYTVNDYPSGIALGDIDHDGDLDIVTSNFISNNVSVLFNDGSGNFSPPINYNVGTNPNDLALGDINNDNSLDIVTANTTSSDISVLLNNGDGTYPSTPTNYSIGGSPLFISLGDINNDGYVDAVVTKDSDTEVSVLLNNGDGSYALPSNYNVANSPNSLALGDLDNDNYLDIVTVGSDFISILTGKNYFAALLMYAVGDIAKDLALGDLNQDGYLDVATVNNSSDDVSILLSIFNP